MTNTVGSAGEHLDLIKVNIKGSSGSRLLHINTVPFQLRVISKFVVEYQSEFSQSSAMVGLQIIIVLVAAIIGKCLSSYAT